MARKEPLAPREKAVIPATVPAVIPVGQPALRPAAVPVIKPAVSPPVKPLVPPAEKTRASGGEESRRVKQDIIQYQKERAPFQGIVLDAPGRTGAEEGGNFLDRLTDMIFCFGIAVGLPAGRSLVLLPASFDRELIAHRLSHSLHAPSLGGFKALEPEGAMKELQPFL
jgi:hypothetical protein